MQIQELIELQLQYKYYWQNTIIMECSERSQVSMPTSVFWKIWVKVFIESWNWCNIFEAFLMEENKTKQNRKE